jgi:hypothetical protein
VSRLLAWLVMAGFGWNETAYFGNNLTAQSPAEMVCDGIVGLMVVALLLTEK